MTINLDDKGSHGPLSELYSATQHVFDEGRKSAEREQDAAALMTERVAQLGNTE
jgi:nucleoside-specific outer membrane channel protein Tsx